MEIFFGTPDKKQDSRAIQYTSEFVNESVLKYIKSVIICFGWGGSAPSGWDATPDPAFLLMQSPTNSKISAIFRKIQDFA